MNDLLPEEQDPQFEELIDLLRHVNLNPLFVDSRERTQILSQARARLFPIERTRILSRASARLFSTEPEVSQFEDMPTPKMRIPGSFPSEPNANRDRPHRGRRFLRLANVLVAVFVVVALIGSCSAYVTYKVFNENKSGVPTLTVTLVAVPNLMGLSWQDASSKAQSAGFQLKSENGSMDGIVISQSPNSGVTASSGSTIEVRMGVQKSTVPTFPLNSSLATVELILYQHGFVYTVKADGTNRNLPPNTVSHISPTSGSSVPANTKITVYVVNYTNGTPAVTPNP
jgi:hypothetical protein